MRDAARTVSQINDLLGIDIWRVRSFRADIRVDFNEYGAVLSVTLLNPDRQPEIVSGVEALQAEYAQIEAEQKRLLRRKLQIATLLAPLGLHDHTHGAGLYDDPFREHAHPFTDPDHLHETPGGTRIVDHT